jgi:hypothetical protein
MNWALPERYLLNEYLMTELAEAVMLVTCSSEMICLNLGQTLTFLTDVFMVFFTLFRWQLWWSLSKASVRVHHALIRQSYGSKVLTVEQDLWCGDLLPVMCWKCSCDDITICVTVWCTLIGVLGGEYLDTYPHTLFLHHSQLIRVITLLFDICRVADKSLAFPISCFPICSTTKIIFLGWVKEVRTTKS